MKKILYLSILAAHGMMGVEPIEKIIPSLPDYVQLIPKEVWRIILAPLITKEYGKTNYKEIKKLKLVSKSFYSVCDSNEIHRLISPDFVKSYLILNTKSKREEFNTLIFKADQEELFWIFQCAVYYAAPCIIKRVIERGIDPNTPYGSTRTPALCRVAFNNNVRASQALLAHPLTDPNVTDGSSDTPLIIAAKKKHTPIIRVLATHPLTNLDKANQRNLIARTICLNNGNNFGANILLLAEARKEREKRSRCCNISDCPIL